MISKISKTRINTIIENIKKDGVAEISNFINEEKINELQNFIYDELKENPDFYQGRAGLEAFRNTPLDKIELETALLDILDATHKKMHETLFLDTTLYKVLRVSKGKASKNQVYKFHFDAYSITALLPIIIPNRKKIKNIFLKFKIFN